MLRHDITKTVFRIPDCRGRQLGSRTVNIKKHVLIVALSLGQFISAAYAADGQAFSVFTDTQKQQVKSFYDQSAKLGSSSFESMDEWAATRPDDASKIKGQLSIEVESACMNGAAVVAPTETDAYQFTCICVGDETITRLWTGPRVDVDEDRLIVGDLLDAEEFCFVAFPPTTGSGGGSRL